MNNNFLKIYSDANSIYLNYLLNGLEEQGIRFEVLPIDEIINLNIAKVPFNLAVELEQNRIELKSNDFKGKINFKATNIDKNIAKEFGLDIGRYIKKLPLRGDWYE